MLQAGGGGGGGTQIVFRGECAANRSKTGVYGMTKKSKVIVLRTNQLGEKQGLVNGRHGQLSTVLGTGS